jgi:pimeloyl-ACP methyl ester carboxylesterase
MSESEGLHTRTYGAFGPPVYVLHGGPAAFGSAAQIALGLADRFRVVEPFQRGSSGVPLTVGQHISDLDDLLQTRNDPVKPIIAGHSWGAMLALAYGAYYPDRIQGVVLIGCGTFDKASRQKMNATISGRISEETQELLEDLPQRYPEPIDRLQAEHNLVKAAYDFNTDQTEMNSDTQFDLKAHTETWNDMLRLQENGTYPQAFASILAPVLMIHGLYDPHPGRMIYDTLRPFIRRLEYVELDQCGHDPWREVKVREHFFQITKDWMSACFGSQTGEI